MWQKRNKPNWLVYILLRQVYLGFWHKKVVPVYSLKWPVMWSDQPVPANTGHTSHPALSYCATPECETTFKLLYCTKKGLVSTWCNFQIGFLHININCAAACFFFFSLRLIVESVSAYISAFYYIGPTRNKEGATVVSGSPIDQADCQ